MMETNKWEKWEKTRAKGTFIYLISHGFVLGFSFGVAFLADKLFHSENGFLINPDKFLLLICFGFIGGLIWGLIEWFFSETAFQRSRKNKDFNIWIPKQKDNLK